MKKIKQRKNIAEALKEAVIKNPSQLKKEIYPHENVDRKARFNTQEDYPGTQPDVKLPDRFKKIGK